VDRVLQEKTSFLTTDALNDPRFRGQQSVLMQQIRSALAAPLFDNAQVIGLLYADTSDPRHWFSKDELRAFTLLANVIAVAITHARYRAMEQEKLRLESELDTAREIIERILPKSLPACAGYDLCAFQDSCYEVGGDLYSVLPLGDGRLGLLMGDVAGKGLGAALLVTNIIPVVQLLSEEAWEPTRLMSRLNQQVWQTTDTVHFATIFWGILEPDSGRLVYVNAGHNPPFIVSAEGNVQKLGPGGLPVGMLEEFPYKSGEARLEPGSVLTLFSDGIPETLNAREEEFGEERLRELVRSQRQQPATRLVEAVLAEVRTFRDNAPAADDVTMLVVKRLAAAGA
jgi:serine phosphatase RsbU (regulator of sigma subunit)